ncbi:MAG: hypothetical protein JWP80_4117 [Pseudomonas sp.]|nr:hypothetical protein [Pseudomonas sp.]
MDIGVRSDAKRTVGAAEGCESAGNRSRLLMFEGRSGLIAAFGSSYSYRLFACANAHQITAMKYLTRLVSAIVSLIANLLATFMSRLSLIWLLVLSLLLPSFGSMALAAAEPCPMMSMPGHTMMQNPCCKDMDHHSGSESPCKPGQDCKTGGTLQSLTVMIFKPVLALPVTLVTPSILTAEPAYLWRPPRSV